MAYLPNRLFKGALIAGMMAFLGQYVTANQEPLELGHADAMYAFKQVQSDLLYDTLSTIQPSTPKKIDWYFMGVAGYSGQDVFKLEIAEARRLFDSRSQTQGHSIALINNESTWLDKPMATKDSIYQALQAIAQKMDVDEDVLFLVLSSHGTTDTFVLDSSIMSLEDIDPVWLRQALDDAGIKWRVIAISSCYSGSFIDELSSPTTVVITAASKDRASFGCSNTSTMTYFGNAFYANSLRSNDSLKSAYRESRKMIRARELAEGFEPSNPQMFMGAKIKKKLPKFEAVLFQQ